MGVLPLAAPSAAICHRVEARKAKASAERLHAAMRMLRRGAGQVVEQWRCATPGHSPRIRRGQPSGSTRRLRRPRNAAGTSRAIEHRGAMPTPRRSATDAAQARPLSDGAAAGPNTARSAWLSWGRRAFPCPPTATGKSRGNVASDRASRRDADAKTECDRRRRRRGRRATALPLDLIPRVRRGPAPGSTRLPLPAYGN